MSKKLAIKGHLTRGKEVIELLEMMGGSSYAETYGLCENRCYFIGDNGWIKWDYIGPKEIDKYNIFTLEEFLEKYPFKVGDKVTLDDMLCTITWMCWECNNIYYQVQGVDVMFTKKVAVDRLKPCDGKCERTHEDVIFDSIIWHLRNSVNNGKQNLSGAECEDYFREVVKKNNENKMKKVLAKLLDHIKNTSKEELEKEFNELEEWSHVGPTVEEFMDFCNKVNKKPKYPKTYEECFNIHTNQSTLGSLVNKTNALYDLFICRNAYWKIAGEQMGLDKPWEPDWNHINRKFCIYNSKNNIVKNIIYSENKILAFPTEEMRDAFYENFKDLIEQCKELL